MKTIVGLYEEPSDAAKAVEALQDGGLATSSVRVLRSVDALWQHLGCTPGRIVLKDFAIGAALGIAFYCLVGVLAATGEVTLGFSRTTAIAVLLLSGLAGIFVGGMLGVFFGLGQMEQESRLYIGGIRRGGALLVMRTADERSAQAMDLLHKSRAKGVKICWRTSDQTARQRSSQPKDPLSLWARRLARGLGTVLVVLVLLYFFREAGLGEGVFDVLAVSLSDDLLVLTMLMALVGVVMAWRWEAAGSLVILGSVLLFEGVNAVRIGHWQVGVFDMLFVLVGLLFLLDWWRTIGRDIDRPAARSI